METNKLTNFIIFKDKKRLDMIKEIFIEGNAFSRMTVDQREREKNKHKITKENIVHVNVLSDNMFIRKVK